MADNNCDCASEPRPGEKGTFELFIFPITCNNHTLTLHAGASLLLTWVCVRACVCARARATLSVRARLITHAVISGKPPFTPAEMKGFPLSQSSFFVSMAL